ncbi:unnamed protein product [Arctia plantaginis]|uniref:Uncharacterized protein n=1 Tax=Arctia plantaginis TaxID=874455 RepID=A0A8S1BPL0_ARCPL|nr:unnamed protein product [Arctia plantaginis]
MRANFAEIPSFEGHPRKAPGLRGKEWKNAKKPFPPSKSQTSVSWEIQKLFKKKREQRDKYPGCVVVCRGGAGGPGGLVALDCARARCPARRRAARRAPPGPAAPALALQQAHYIFVYKVLSEYGNKMLGGGVDTI